MKKYMKPSVLSSMSVLEDPIALSLGVGDGELTNESEFLGKDRDFFDSDAKDDDSAWSDGLW